MITGRINQIAFTFFSKNHEKTLVRAPTAARRESAVLPGACRKERRETAAWDSDEVTGERRNPPSAGLVRIRRSSEAERTEQRTESPRHRSRDASARHPGRPRFERSARRAEKRERCLPHHAPDNPVKGFPTALLPATRGGQPAIEIRFWYRTGQSVPLRKAYTGTFRFCRPARGGRETNQTRRLADRPLRATPRGKNQLSSRRRSTVSIEPGIVSECAVTGRVSDTNAPPPSDRFVACGKNKRGKPRARQSRSRKQHRFPLSPADITSTVCNGLSPCLDSTVDQSNTSSIVRKNLSCSSIPSTIQESRMNLVYYRRRKHDPGIEFYAVAARRVQRGRFFILLFVDFIIEKKKNNHHIASLPAYP